MNVSIEDNELDINDGSSALVDQMIEKEIIIGLEKR